ncbi:LacI family DNA-binding transcriptional regulator [Thermanaeromonas sp. C210]|uniref:LacI family DNA-binding transcriptional regulator n=1 Tax=Thermanaeromonas sp. C210 TaxID=2731925 RepID=UPI00155CFDCC|nr:LacI family DNA-binding transcriptional regulator [Thermanaeromonas sp. C210]GFN24245.1 LacI family transcriptional regulator [Thermanaeromonas sp. C210]
MPTIYDVAKAAGVSIATVSRVINGYPFVSEKTREKVLQVMQELNYSPNILAAALMKKVTYTVGLLIPDISNPFFAEITRGAEDAANKFGFNTIICNTDNDSEKETKYINLLLQKSVDGLIFATSEIVNQNILMLKEKKFPMVLIAREVEGSGVDVVLADNVQGAYEGVKYLIELGHRTIAFVGEPLTIKSTQERLAGYEKALKDAGLPIVEHLILTGFKTLEETYKKIKSFYWKTRPSAIFATNDVLAIGVIRGLKELRINIPEDVSIVSFDDTVFASIAEPPLTSVAQPMRQMGQLAIMKLINRIRNKEEAATKIVLPTKLVVRNSTTKFKGT